MARANAIVSVTETQTGMTFVVNGAGSITLVWAQIAESNMQRAARFGMKQRLSDAAARPRDPATGESASSEEKFAAIKRLADHYNSGTEEWEIARGTFVRGPDPLVLQAIEEVKGWARGEALPRIQLTAEDKKLPLAEVVKVLAGHSRVAAVVARLRAERTGLNSAVLLDEV